MDKNGIQKLIADLATKKIEMAGKDFFLTWEKTRDEIDATFLVAEILQAMRTNNISPRIWDSGIAVSNFRDNSTRTRFSFASACDLLGPLCPGPGRGQEPAGPRRDGSRRLPP